jgi:hypothetical protein
VAGQAVALAPRAASGSTRSAPGRARRGCRRERRIGSALPAAFLALCTLGALRPITLLVRKPA